MQCNTIQYNAMQCNRIQNNTSSKPIELCFVLLCQYVRMQLFSLGIKTKVVQNVIRMSDRQYVIVVQNVSENSFLTNL